VVGGARDLYGRSDGGHPGFGKTLCRLYQFWALVPLRAPRMTRFPEGSCLTSRNLFPRSSSSRLRPLFHFAPTGAGLVEVALCQARRGTSDREPGRRCGRHPHRGWSRGRAVWPRRSGVGRHAGCRASGGGENSPEIRKGDHANPLFGVRVECARSGRIRNSELPSRTIGC
jgi:hypothetical protein